MKKNSIIYITLIGFLFSLSLMSCKFEEKDIFSDSAAIRMEKTLASYEDILCAASNGWVMEYFPTDTTEGYTFLMKFNTSTKVIMAAKNRWIGNKYTVDSCVFRLVGDDGPVLSFPSAGTYKINGSDVGIFHLFSAPVDPRGGGDLDGSGLEGDYEFVVMSANTDSIVLRGKKRGTDIIMRKMDENTTWKNYFDKIDEMKANILTNNLEDLALTYGNGDSYFLKTNLQSYGNYATKFKIYPSKGDVITDGVDYAYIITPKGIKFHTPFKGNNVSSQTFILSEDKQKLVCADKGVDAYISSMSPVFIFNYLLNKGKYMIFNNSTDNMSTSIKSAYDKISTAISNSSRKFEYLGFTNNKTWGNSLAVYTTKTNTSKIEGFLFYDITYKGDKGVTLKFNGYEKNGETYYKNYSMSDLVSLLDGDYTLSVKGSLSSTTIRFTSTTDNTKWFDLKLK